jgi:uncharacterized membrane protein
MLTSIESSVEVGVPARTAYNQWTQFEEFPRIMPRFEAASQVDDSHVQLRERLAGKPRSWVMEICEQIPDKRIAWTSSEGPRNSGAVTFHRLDDDRCKVMFQMEFEAGEDGPATYFALAREGVERDLLGFKEFLERKGKETGAWRGAIPSPDDRVEPEASAVGQR